MSNIVFPDAKNVSDTIPDKFPMRWQVYYKTYYIGTKSIWDSLKSITSEGQKFQ